MQYDKDNNPEMFIKSLFPEKFKGYCNETFQ